MAMTICLFHGDFCELNIRCSWPYLIHGELLHLQYREQFSLLSHLSWFVKAWAQENAVVTWLCKPIVEHPYEWQVRIRVWLTRGYRDLLMGLTWDTSSEWVTGTPPLIVQVRQLLFGNEVTMGELARVQCVFLLSEPETACAPSE